jgi:F420-non-reducing hydrogenase iron-sulfur subunit
LESIGLEGQRLQMINVSAAMAGEFTFSAAEITAEIRQMGPNPLRKNGAHAQQRNHEQAEHILGGEDVDND